MQSRGGAAKTKDLLAAGFSRNAVATALGTGSVIRLRSGLYAVHGAGKRIVAALLANGLLTCASAISYYGLWSLNAPSAMHLSCGNGLPRQGVVDHSPCRHPAHPFLPIAGLADVLLHAARCLPEFEALVIVQCAVSRGMISLDFLRRKLPGNRNGRARAVLDLVLPRADSLLEVLAHTLFASRAKGPHARRTSWSRRSGLPGRGGPDNRAGWIDAF
jgi:hypothetical protein